MASRGAPRGRGGSFGGRGGGGKLCWRAPYQPVLCFANGATGVGHRGGFQQRDFGPPASVVEMGKFLHACECEIVCASTNPRIPRGGAGGGRGGGAGGGK